MCVCSEMCGDVDSLELGDTVEYTLSKGKGNKVSAEKVTKVTPGRDRLKFVYSFNFCIFFCIFIFFPSPPVLLLFDIPHSV